MGESTEREAAPTPPLPWGALRRRRQSHSDPSSSGSAASSSSSGRREAEAGAEEEGEGQGGGNKQGRRKGKRREVVVRAIRERLPAAPSCWGNVSAVQGRSRRGERPGDVGRGGDAVEEDASGAGTATAATAAAWCCVCPDGDCSLEPNPSAYGKEDAGFRSLIERNDFYSDDCNPHAAAADSSVASPRTHFD